MTKFSFVEASVDDRLELVKAINELLGKGWELHGTLVVVFDSTKGEHVLYQALVKNS